MTTLLTSIVHSSWLAKAAEPVRWLTVTAIAYTLATSVSYFLADPARANIPAPSTSPTPAAAVQASFDLNAMKARNLFGKLNSNPEAANVQEKIVETRLPLELHGVFVADVPEDSAAIVAPKNKPGKLYTIGESVPGNAKLIEVYADRVLLRRAGVSETLRFFDSDGGFVEEKPVASAAKPGASGPASGPQPRTAREFVETYRERLTDDPDELLKELGVTPVTGEGSQGYRLGNLANSPYLSRTGLQPGDVLLSVNGRPLGNVQSDKLELDNVLAQGSARLEVQRGSRRFYVTASLK